MDSSNNFISVIAYIEEEITDKFPTIMLLNVSEIVNVTYEDVETAKECGSPGIAHVYLSNGLILYIHEPISLRKIGDLCPCGRHLVDVCIERQKDWEKVN